MSTTLYTVAPVTRFSAQGYDIVQAGTVVPDGVVWAIQTAAAGAGVTLNTSAGGAPQLVQVPSYYNGGTGAPVGDSLPVGAEVKDSTGAVFEKTPGGWVSAGAQSGTFESIATPTLRRRHLPHVADALAVNGEIPTVTHTSAFTITTSLIPPKRIGNVTGAAWDIAGDPTMAVLGTPSMPADVASPNNRVRASITTGGTGQSARYVPTFAFYTDAPAFELNILTPGNVLIHRLVVDGKLSVADGQFAISTDGVVKFDFGSAKTRHIQLTINDPQYLGIKVAATYSVWRPPQLPARRLFAVGDSITYSSANGVLPTETWMWDLGRMLGCDDVWNVGVGGTGWVTDGTSTTRFSDRVTTDLVPILQPNDVVLFFGSRNDPSGTGPQLAAITAAVTSTLALVSSVKNVFVATNITVIGTLAAAVIAGAQAAGRQSIDASGWITGTGTTSAPNGTGNSDRYIGVDGVHPTVGGEQYLAQRWGSALRALLPA